MLLSEPELTAALTHLPHWQRQGSTITRRYHFRDFVAAFGWMTQVALVAERLNHHPEWTNVWNRVDVVLTTHDSAGITEKDIALAKAMDEAAAPLLAR